MLLAYNQYWQMPAQTEKHAFLKMQAFLKDNTLNAVYLAFPWATLFDARDRKNTVLLTELEQALSRLISQIPEDWPVFTVCQHIRLSRHQHYLVQAKVNTVFWSHATIKDQELPFTIMPFPLYPVHKGLPHYANGVTVSNYLCSFVGAKSNQYYLTESRNWLFELIADQPDCVIKLNEQWFFNQQVYGEQIEKIQFSEQDTNSSGCDTTYAFIMAQSIFALCPSGTGPNSIRLWEAITAGVIPVILSDKYLPPGKALLWQQAALFWPETPESIAALPAYLRELAADPSVLAAKRHALRQLAILYGPEGFVIDIMQLMMHYAPAFNVNLDSPLLQLGELVTNSPTLENCRHFALSINSYRLLADPIVFHPKVQQAFAVCKAAISHAK